MFSADDEVVHSSAALVSQPGSPSAVVVLGATPTRPAHTVQLGRCK